VRVLKAQIAECRIPLPTPIRLGPVEITTRDYVALRLVSDTGTYGDALGYPRGSSLFDTVVKAAAFFVGKGVDSRRAAVEDYLRGAVTVRPNLVRAASLYDIALADLAAKSFNAPLFRLLGAVRDRVPVAAVAGYYLDQRSIDDVTREIGTLLDAGYPRIKIMLSGRDPEFDRRYVAAASKVAEGRLGADAHWSFETIAQALATLRGIDDYGLMFVEDPFPAHRNHLLGKLQPLLTTRIAAGEDMPDADSLFGLTDHLSILRVDATTCGGITSALAVTEAAALRGTDVFPHVFLPLHAQMAGTTNAVSAVEYIPAASGADPLDQLLDRPIEIIDGHVQIDQEPGAGIAFDWVKVESRTARAATVDMPS
jgi:L-alanine-DL-glutamate epimerase-like enolase superfamily enzyme